MIDRAAAARPKRTSKPRATFQRDVPDDIRALDTIENPDYADLFRVPAATSHITSPKRWAHDLVGNAPPSMRLLTGGALLVQRALLGLRSTPGVPQADRLITGWHIAARGDRWLRLEASGRMMSGHIVIRLDDDRITGATFVRYHGRTAALVWPPVSLVHRQVGLALMRYAARSTDAMQP